MNARRVVMATTLATTTAVVLAPAPAAAQLAVEAAPRRGSPQHFALELRFGPFSPNVDSELGGATPHRDFFGSDRRLMTQVEVDFQVFDRFGTLALGASIGYFRESGRAFLDPGPGQAATERAGDETRLVLLPMAALLVYRFDVAARAFRFPLVPYGKLGLNYTLWSIYDGNDEVVEGFGNPPGRSRGATPGWQGAVGVAFLLDVLDPGAARELDGEVGINHTYVFAELSKVSSTGERKLRVGGSTWYAGLMFEF